MKKSIKFLILPLLLALIFCLLPATSVQAATEKTYTIHTADIQVYLRENGDADIVETWLVTFETGDFTRFRKEIYTGAGGIEKFDKVTNVSVKIDGVPCEQSKTDGYQVTREDDLCIISAYKASSNVTRTYEFAYTLTNVVKKTGEDTSEFSYRFVGKNHSTNIEKLTISVFFPVAGTVAVENLTKGNHSIENNALVFRAEDSLGLYSLHVKLTTDQPFGKTYNKNAGEVAASVILALAGIAVLIVVLRIDARNRKRKQYLAKLEAEALEGMATDPLYVRNLVARLREKLTPVEIAWLLRPITAKEPYRFLMGTLAELCHKDLIRFDEKRENLLFMCSCETAPDGTKLFYNFQGELQKDLRQYQQTMLEMLDDCGDDLSRQQGIAENPIGEDRDAFHMDDLKRYLFRSNTMINDFFRAVIAQLSTSALNICKLYPHCEDDRLRLKYCLSSMSTSTAYTFEDILARIDQKQMQAIILIEYLLAENAPDMDTQNSDTAMGRFLKTLAVIPYTLSGLNNKDSGGCSSCSGCSGCGGCGGCGGD